MCLNIGGGSSYIVSVACCAVALLLVSCCSFISDGLLVELARALARLLLRRRGGSCRESVVVSRIPILDRSIYP